MVAGLLGAYVLLGTIFTAPSIAAALVSILPSWPRGPGLFSPTRWHESPLHLLFVVVLILLTGPVVERHLGNRGFVLFWVYCTVGTAVPAIVLASLATVPPISGGLAPALGIVFARAWFGEDDEVSLEPLPVRLRLRVLAAGLIPVLALPALVWSSSAISLRIWADSPRRGSSSSSAARGAGSTRRPSC